MSLCDCCQLDTHTSRPSSIRVHSAYMGCYLCHDWARSRSLLMHQAQQQCRKACFFPTKVSIVLPGMHLTVHFSVSQHTHHKKYVHHFTPGLKHCKWHTDHNADGPGKCYRIWSRLQTSVYVLQVVAETIETLRTAGSCSRDNCNRALSVARDCRVHTHTAIATL